MSNPLLLIERSGLELRDLQATKDRVALLRDDNEFGKARTLIEKAIERLEKTFGELEGLDAGALNEVQLEALRFVAQELADAHGIAGGLCRRLYSDQLHAGLQDTIRHYERGAELESRYEIPSSYNLVNYIVSRVQNGESTTSMKDLTKKAAERVAQLVLGPKRGDWWALADLGLISSLNFNEVGANESYSELKKSKAPKWVFESITRVINEVANKLVSSVEMEDRLVAAILQKAIDDLNQR